MKYLTNIMWLSAVIICIFAVAAVVLGALALPIVLAVKCSWYWLFLFLVYLVGGLGALAWIAEQSRRAKE